MADITFSGVMYDKYARTARPVVLIGEAMGKMPDPPPPDPTDPGNGNGGNNPPGQDKKQKKWEYKVFYTRSGATDWARHDEEFIEKMNELGAEGWYLASTDDMYVYFVRELDQ